MLVGVVPLNPMSFDDTVVPDGSLFTVITSVVPLVIVAQPTAVPAAAVHAMLAGSAFSEAGHRVILEQSPEGDAASFLVMSADMTSVLLATAPDPTLAGCDSTRPYTVA